METQMNAFFSENTCLEVESVNSELGHTGNLIVLVMYYEKQRTYGVPNFPVKK